jgi:hypothetical protein
VAVPNACGGASPTSPCRMGPPPWAQASIQLASASEPPGGQERDLFQEDQQGLWERQLRSPSASPRGFESESEGSCQGRTPTPGGGGCLSRAASPRSCRPPRDGRDDSCGMAGAVGGAGARGGSRGAACGSPQLLFAPREEEPSGFLGLVGSGGYGHGCAPTHARLRSAGSPSSQGPSLSPSGGVGHASGAAQEEGCAEAGTGASQHASGQSGICPGAWGRNAHGGGGGGGATATPTTFKSADGFNFLEPRGASPEAVVMARWAVVGDQRSTVE